MSEICLKGAKDICEAVGENPRNITELVRDKGLPAWKRDDKGSWRALPETCNGGSGSSATAHQQLRVQGTSGGAG